MSLEVTTQRRESVTTARIEHTSATQGGNAMFTTIKNLLRDESGVTAIEYGLIAALVAVAAVGAMETLGTGISDIFGTVESNLSTGSSSGG
ncbi:Flp family type IVb pilin [Limimonas halophila]|uniref:Flp family type IVb pilin n=1 Tax=Limimonas halophila TaxID=1082479 RepID=UPI003F58DC07